VDETNQPVTWVTANTIVIVVLNKSCIAINMQAIIVRRGSVMQSANKKQGIIPILIICSHTICVI